MRAGRSGPLGLGLLPARLRLGWLTAVAIALLAAAPMAQGQSSPPASPILTLDQDRLFTATLWGQRVSAELAATTATLAAESRQLEAELTAEEQALTDARPTMTPEDFRAAADAFDARVVEIRRTRDTKSREVARLEEVERQRFYASVLPVLGATLTARGAVAVLDARAIFLAADTIDVTDEMIAAVDAAFGDGSQIAPAAPAPAPAPVPTP